MSGSPADSWSLIDGPPPGGRSPPARPGAFLLLALGGGMALLGAALLALSLALVSPSAPPPPTSASPTPALPAGFQAGERPGTQGVRLPDGGWVELAWVPWGAGDDRAHGFYLGRQEVSRAQLRAFRAARQGRPAPDPQGDDALPATDVSWEEADAFCAWAGLRLPTLAEWRRAAARAASRVEDGPQGCLALSDGAQEWLRDAVASAPWTPLGGLQVPAPQRAVNVRFVAGGTGQRPVWTAPTGALQEGASSPQVGFRVAGPEPAARWHLLACGFTPLEAERSTRGPVRDFPRLLAEGGPRVELDLERLGLRFQEQGPGQLPGAAGRVPGDFFALQATTRLALAAGRWRLVVQADDGVRVWIDEQLVADAWIQDEKCVICPLELAAPRSVTVRVEQVELLGWARLEAWFERLE